MTATFTAVYRDGAFHPTSPPDLPDGTTVQLTVAADPTPPPVPSPQQVFEQLMAISKLAVEHPGAPTDVARNHDKYLYGGPEYGR